jgi:hypothetical protein
MSDKKSKKNGMEELLKLDKKEVANKTHISIKSLEHIINKDFDELHKTKTLGFIKILEKNYSLDLSDWLEEFLEYKDDNVVPEISLMTQNLEEKKSKTPIIIALVILVFVISYFLVPMLSKEKDVAQNQDEIIEKIKDNISEAKGKSDDIKGKNSDTIAIDNRLDKIQETQETSTDKVDTNSKKESNKEDAKVAETKPKEQRITINVPHNKPLASEVKEAMKYEPIEKIALTSNKIVVDPRGKVWIGIINTNNFTRIQKTIDGEGELVLKDGHLIITGHSYFTLIDNESKTNYEDMNASYFFYKDGILNKITKEHFKKLNRDSMW